MGFQQAFDYIIIGAGSAGCVLANRLSEDPCRRVLLLEAGGSDHKSEVQIPVAFTKLFKTERDWAYATVPQPALRGRELFWPRGRMLGGCSSMNAQLWVRGCSTDYEGWEALGNPGWGWESVLEAFLRTERRATGPLDLYGTDGPLRVESLRDPNPTTAKFLSACRELGLRALRDINEPDNEGFGMIPVTQRRGRRWSCADAYLRPALRRSNLTVITQAHVQRMLFKGRRAHGVEYRDGANVLRRVEAAGEVLLCGGAVNSPQLLMLSGIGPAEHLKAHGIPVICDRRDVGENLQDHLTAPVICGWRDPVTLVSAESVSNLLKYLVLRKGMLTSCVAEALAFVRTREALPAPDIELLWAPVPFIDHGFVTPPGHGVTLAPVLLQPKSRGRLQLRSARAADAPTIDPGYLTAPEDLSTLVASVKWVRRLFGSQALAPYLTRPIEPGPGTESDAGLADFIREQAETLYHPVGTCRMGSDEHAVVDPELRVRGVEGLRVVDASVMPRITRGHTHAPTVMIAERAAGFILS